MADKRFCLVEKFKLIGEDMEPMKGIKFALKLLHLSYILTLYRHRQIHRLYIYLSVLCMV